MNGGRRGDAHCVDEVASRVLGGELAVAAT